MDRNDRVLLWSLLLGTALCLAVWAVITGSFDRPAERGGWVYEYQTLIGVAGALLAAFLTIRMMHREQRQQREHFERQVEIMTRPDRLRVSRETAEVIPRLRGALAEIRANATLAVSGARGAETRGQRLARISNELANRLDADVFAELTPILDDNFTELRGRAEARARDLLNTVYRVFTGRLANLPGAYEWRNVTGAEEIELLRRNRLVEFPELERDLGTLIEFLQDLRRTYRLPALGMRHDEHWRVRQARAEA